MHHLRCWGIYILTTVYMLISLCLVQIKKSSLFSEEFYRPVWQPFYCLWRHFEALNHLEDCFILHSLTLSVILDHACTSKVNLQNSVIMQLPVLLHLWGFRQVAASASVKAVSRKKQVHPGQIPRLLAVSIPRALEYFHLPVAVWSVPPKEMVT